MYRITVQQFDEEGGDLDTILEIDQATEVDPDVTAAIDGESIVVIIDDSRVQFVTCQPAEIARFQELAQSMADDFPPRRVIAFSTRKKGGAS